MKRNSKDQFPKGVRDHFDELLSKKDWFHFLGRLVGKYFSESERESLKEKLVMMLLMECHHNEKSLSELSDQLFTYQINFSEKELQARINRRDKSIKWAQTRRATKRKSAR